MNQPPSQYKDCGATLARMYAGFLIFYTFGVALLLLPLVGVLISESLAAHRAKQKELSAQLASELAATTAKQSAGD